MAYQPPGAWPQCGMQGLRCSLARLSGGAAAGTAGGDLGAAPYQSLRWNLHAGGATAFFGMLIGLCVAHVCGGSSLRGAAR